MIEIDINLDNYEGHDENLLADLKKLEIIRISFSNKYNPKENKDLAIKFLNNCNPAV